MNGRDIILGLLVEKSRTGYEINKHFKTVFSHYYQTSYGMIYPTLKKLQNEGFVEKKTIIQDGKPNKNLFIVTEEGKKEFEKSLSNEIIDDVYTSEFLVRMYFGEYVSDEVIAELILEQMKKIEQRMAQLSEDLVEWETVMNDTQRLTYDIRLNQYEAELKILRGQLPKYEK